MAEIVNCQRNDCKGVVAWDCDKEVLLKAKVKEYQKEYGALFNHL